MAGLPKSYIKKYGITKKAWRMYRASKKKSKSKSKTRKTSNKKGGRKMAKSGFNTAKIFSLLRTVSLLAPAVSHLLTPTTNQERLIRTVRDYTGYNITHQKLEPNRLLVGWGPYLMTNLMTYGVPKLTKLIRNII